MDTESIAIKSFQGFVKVATAKSKDGWLFRGHKDASWQLLPSVDRHKVNGLSARLLEVELLREFRNRVRPFISQEPSDKWEWLAIAQHHGLSTRLLDWTTNPLVGLYFAVEEENYDGDSAVWCYRPAGWSVALPNDPFDIYQITLYEPPHVSPRITPQSGLFTAHPPRFSFSPNGEYASDWPGRLFKIEIPTVLREDLRSTLTGLGVHRASLFPGLDGVGQFLARTWKSWTEIGSLSVRAGEEPYREKVKSLRDGRSGEITFYNLNRDLGVLDCATVAWEEKDGQRSEPSIELLQDLEFPGAGVANASTVRRIPRPILR